MTDPINTSTSTPPASPAGETPAADQTEENITFGDASGLITFDDKPEETPQNSEPDKPGAADTTDGVKYDKPGETKKASRELRRLIKVDNSAIHDTDEGFLDKINPLPEMKQKREVRNTVVKELVTSAPAGSTRDQIVVQGKQKLAAKVEAAGSDAGHLALGAKEYVTVQDLNNGRRFVLTEMDQIVEAPPPAGETTPAGGTETAEGTTLAEEAAPTVHDHPIPKSDWFPKESAIDDPNNAGKKLPYFTDDLYSGQVIIPEGMPGDQREQAARSAAYYTGQGMGLDSRQAAIYAEDVLRNNDNNPDDALVKVNADLNNYYNSQSPKSDVDNPVKDYRNPKDYAVSRVFDEDSPEVEVAEFRKNLGEQLKGKTPAEKWEAVHHPDLKDGEEYKNAVLGSGTAAADGEFTRSNNIGYGNNVYDDATQEDKALEVANAINDKARQEYEAVKTAKAWEKYQKTRGEVAGALKENPKQLERMSEKEFPDDPESRFISSKGANSRAAEARKESRSGAGRVVDKIGKTKTDTDTVSGAVKAPLDAVSSFGGALNTVVGLPKAFDAALENEKVTGILETGVKLGATLAAKERTGEQPVFVKGDEKYSENYGKPAEGSPGATLAAGTAAGTAPTAQPGSMLARKEDSEGKRQQSEKSERTWQQEDLASQLAANRRINRKV